MPDKIGAFLVNRVPFDESINQMISNDEKALAALNALIRVGRDAEKGFLDAADGVDDPELVQLFAEYGLQRAKFVAELQDRVKVLRGEAEDSVGSSRVDLQACKLEYSIVSPK